MPSAVMPYGQSGQRDRPLGGSDGTGCDVVDETLTGPTIPMLVGSAAFFALGYALFGAAMIRARVLLRIPSWGYAVVLPLFAFLTALPDSLLTSALHVLVGVILLWLSAALWRMAPSVEHSVLPNRVSV
jgi:hypothetical protein